MIEREHFLAGSPDCTSKVSAAPHMLLAATRLQMAHRKRCCRPGAQKDLVLTTLQPNDPKGVPAGTWACITSRGKAMQKQADQIVVLRGKICRWMRGCPCVLGDACHTAVCGCVQVDQIVALRGEILQVNEGLRLSEAGKLEAEAQVQALKDQIAARKADGER